MKENIFVLTIVFCELGSIETEVKLFHKENDALLEMDRIAEGYKSLFKEGELSETLKVHYIFLEDDNTDNSISITMEEKNIL